MLEAWCSSFRRCSQDVQLFDSSEVVEHVDRTCSRLRRGQLDEHRLRGRRGGGRQFAPPPGGDVGPDVRVGLVAPQALDLLVRQPKLEVDTLYAADLIRLDRALAVPDPEVAVVTPGRPPAVLGDPARLAVVVPDQRDAVATGDPTSDVPVDTAGVAEEVLVDGEAGVDGAVRRD